MKNATVTPTTITKSTNDLLADFINQWNKFSNCYFWMPPPSASGRRSYEKYHSRTIDLTIGDNHIEGEIAVSCSCKNVYCTRTLKINGEQLRITALHRIIKNTVVEGYETIG